MPATRTMINSGRLAALGAAAALALAACGSSGSSHPAAATNTSGHGSTTQTQTQTGTGAVVSTHQGSAGTYLTDSSGRTLYLWTADRMNTSTCSGACAAAWPPLTTKGAPTAKTPAEAKLLGTTKRSDGTTQVTYAGWPLYRFIDDSAPGQTNGQGSNGFGAKWWMVTPSGHSITGSSATPTPSSGKTHSNGGGGYGGY